MKVIIVIAADCFNNTSNSHEYPNDTLKWLHPNTGHFIVVDSNNGRAAESATKSLVMNKHEGNKIEH